MLLKTILITILLLSASSPAQEVKTNQPDSAQIGKAQNNRFPFLPPGTVIHARKGNQIFCFLPKNMEIQGVMCRGHKYDWETGFYTNGKLSLAWLPRDQVIQDAPCMKASFWTEVFSESARVLFHENGQLARCKLAKDCTIQGHTFKKGDIIHFDDQGNLIGVK